MKTLQKHKQIRAEDKKRDDMPVWRKRWEKEYEKNLKSGRFIKEDGIC